MDAKTDLGEDATLWMGKEKSIRVGTISAASSFFQSLGGQASPHEGWDTYSVSAKCISEDCKTYSISPDGVTDLSKVGTFRASNKIRTGPTGAFYNGKLKVPEDISTVV